MKDSTKQEKNVEIYLNVQCTKSLQLQIIINNPINIPLFTKMNEYDLYVYPQTNCFESFYHTTCKILKIKILLEKIDSVY